MKRNIGFALVALVATVVLASSALAQAGHPLKGSWSGDWGPTPDHRNRVLLLLDWVDNEVVGTINPGRNAVPLTSATLNPEDWTIRFEAQAPDARGNMLEYVIEGTVENLGSWTNRRISGTWQHGDQMGDFMVILN
jgi:hypothetical protein